MLRTSGSPFELDLSTCRRSTSCSTFLSLPPWACHSPFPTVRRLDAWPSIHHEEHHVPAAIVQRMLAEPQEMGSLALLGFGRSPDSVASFVLPTPLVQVLLTCSAGSASVHPIPPLRGSSVSFTQNKNLTERVPQVSAKRARPPCPTSCHVTHHAHGYGETQGGVQKQTDGVTKLPW